MHVVWKRPDGFHGASPQDFHVVDIGGRARLWLHKDDHTNFPFRIAGGWQESAATHRLNRLINLVGEPTTATIDCLIGLYNDSMGDNPEQFLSDLNSWLRDLRNHLKGDTWEVDIMDQVIQAVLTRVTEIEGEFVKNTSK